MKSLFPHLRAEAEEAKTIGNTATQLLVTLMIGEMSFCGVVIVRNEDPCLCGKKASLTVNSEQAIVFLSKGTKFLTILGNYSTMTLVFGGSGLGHIIQHSFGVNEISSMITIGKAIGSVVTRASDSSIFDPLASQYGIHVTKVPQWLRKVDFDRSGSILGERQRKVNVPNTMEGVEINSLAGIATFLVLILRFVEPPADIIEDIEDLLRGTYGVVDGGTLALNQAPVVDGKIKRESLPFSLRGLLRTFINSVTDADAQSPQRLLCLRYMAQLTTASGSARLARGSLKYSKFEIQNLLSFLLQDPGDDVRSDNQFLNTSSAGAAMVGLAASANGADVLVECITESGTVQINKPSSSAESLRKSCCVVRLWLKQPPTTIMRDLNAKGGMTYDTKPDATVQLSLPVYGGELELSLHVAHELECDLREEEILTIWQASIATGQSATWTCRRGINTEVNLIYKDDFLHCDVPFDLARMADGYLGVPKGDPRLRLARKAASVIHECFKANDYSSFAHAHFHSTTNLVVIGIFVGSMKALISNGRRSLRVYAWTADVNVLLGFIQKLADYGTGLSNFHILQQAARIWGGLVPRYLSMPRSDDRMGVEGSSEHSAVGIVCPQLILLSNILLEPKSMAQRGIDAGLLSCYEGSSPMLPQDQNSGFIFAASLPYTRPPYGLDLSLSNALSVFEPPDQDSDINSEFDQLVFSVEPAHTAHGTLGIGLCVWHSGDYLMMLDPSVTLRNLLSSRSIEGPMYKRTNRLPNHLGAFVAHLGTDVLPWLECGLLVRHGSCMIDVGPDFEWLVVAAGICAQPLVLCLTSAEDVETVLDPSVLFEDNTIILICRPERTATSQSSVEERGNINGVLVWYDVGRTKGPPKVLVGGLEFPK